MAAFLPVAPFDSPLAVVEAPAVDKIDERRIRARAVVEAAQVGEHHPVSLASRSEEPECLVTRQFVGEEQPQERFVAHLDPRLVAVQPALELTTAGCRDPVDATGAPAPVCVLAGDPACFLD